MLRLDLSIAAPVNNMAGKIIAYSTFNQGSSKSEVDLSENKNPLTLSEMIGRFWGNWLSPISLVGIFLTIIVGIIIPIIIKIVKTRLETKTLKRKKKIKWLYIHSR